MSKNLALFLAVEKYSRKSGFGPLPGAVSDAEAISKILEQDFGYECTVLTNSKCKRESISQLIQEELPRKMRMEKDNSFFLYLSGHGERNVFKQDGVIVEKGYFVPADGKKGDKDTLIDLTEIREWCLRNIPAGLVFIAVDVCHAGEILRRRISAAGEEGKVIHVLASGTAEDEVFDRVKNGYSPFASAFLEAFSGWGGIGEEGEPHSISASELMIFVQSRVIEMVGLAGQSPVGGYLARSPDTAMEFEFTPQKPRIRPSLVRSLQAEDPIVKLMTLSEFIDVLGLEIHCSLPIGILPTSIGFREESPDESAWRERLRREEGERRDRIELGRELDRRLLFIITLKEGAPIQKPKLIRSGKIEPPDSATTVQMVEAILRLIKRDNEENLYPVQDEKPESIDHVRAGTELLREALAMIVYHFPLIEGGIEAARGFDWQSCASRMFMSKLFHYVFKPQDLSSSWDRELYDEVANKMLLEESAKIFRQEMGTEQKTKPRGDFPDYFKM